MFIRTIPRWNSLSPSEVTAQTTEEFRILFSHEKREKRPNYFSSNPGTMFSNERASNYRKKEIKKERKKERRKERKKERKKERRKCDIFSRDEAYYTKLLRTVTLFLLIKDL